MQDHMITGLMDMMDDELDPVVFRHLTEETSSEDDVIQYHQSCTGYSTIGRD